MPDVSLNTQRSLVLALDIGTSSVRASLYDERGEPVAGTEARITRSLNITGDGGAQMDAQEAIAQVEGTIDDVLLRVSNREARIEAVAVSCFWHSLVGVDAEGNSVTPVFGWADTRAARAALTLRKQLDETRAHERVGCRFHPSYWPAKLLWLREERAAVFRSVRRWMSFGELLMLTFFNETEMSISMASGTGLLNLRSCAWDEELLASLNISVEHLPQVAETHKPFNKLADTYARRWPQLLDARWFPAIADGAANNVGAGCTTRESCALMIGTSGAMRVMWEGDPPTALHPALWCYRVDEKRILVGGALSDGGGLYDWMKDALGLKSTSDETEKELARLAPDAHGLTMLPFWSGERSTNWSVDASGAILGLKMGTRPIEILRAAMEAVAYRFALISAALERFAPGAHLVATGGALFRSRVWAQMIADVLNRPLHLPAWAEASSRGACLLALEATGKLKNIGHTQERADLAQTFEPDEASHRRYRAGLERQQNFYARLVANEEWIDRR